MVTWAHHIIIQAVADAMNLRLHIIESNENFSHMTLVEPSNMINNPMSIYLGHIGEMHYVSTLSTLSQTSSNQTHSETFHNNVTESSENERKTKHNAYMKEYRKKQKDKTGNSKQEKEKKANYMRQYRIAKGADRQTDHLV